MVSMTSRSLLTRVQAGWRRVGTEGVLGRARLSRFGRWAPLRGDALRPAGLAGSAHGLLRTGAGFPAAGVANHRPDRQADCRRRRGMLLAFDALAVCCSPREIRRKTPWFFTGIDLPGGP